MAQYCWNHLRSDRRPAHASRRRCRARASACSPRAACRRAHRIAVHGRPRSRCDSDESGGPYFLQTATRGARHRRRAHQRGDGPLGERPARHRRSAPTREFVLHTPPGRPAQCLREDTTARSRRGRRFSSSYGAALLALPPRRAQTTSNADGRAADGDAGPPTATAAARSTAIDAARPRVAVATLTRRASRDRRPSLDAAYQRALANPPAGVEAVHGLLFADRRLVRAQRRRAAHAHPRRAATTSATGAHFGRDKTLAAVQAPLRLDAAWPPTSSATWRRATRASATSPAAADARPADAAADPRATVPGVDARTPSPACRARKRGHDAIQVYVERLCKLKHFAAARQTDGAVELARSFVHTRRAPARRAQEPSSATATRASPRTSTTSCRSCWAPRSA